MNIKSKIICLLLVFVLFLSVGAVSADEMATQSIIGESTEHSSVNTEIVTDEILSASNDVENLESPDDRTFNALQYKINSTSSGDIIKLENDYANRDNFNQSGIIISKPLTIDGDGYTIDALGKGRIFNIISGNVTLKNINFINANYIEDFGNGGAIFWNGNYGILENCTFDNCLATEGGAIYYVGNEKGTILGSNFTDCSSEFSGGAIFSMGNLDCSVVDCNFVNCSSDRGGAILWVANNEGFVVDCNFTDCLSYIDGGAIYWEENAAGYIAGCNFLNCVLDYDLDEGEGGGGAIYSNGNEDCHLYNSTFVNCSAIGFNANGGAIKWGNDNSTIDNCNFVDCYASFEGGAISLNYVNYVSVVNCNFTDCSAEYDGGAIVSYFSDHGTIHNCKFINCNTTFVGNTADSYASGGAITLLWCHNNTIDNSIFENCSSVGYGGAIYSFSQISNNTVNNCIFTHNSAVSGSAIYFRSPDGTFSIKNSILLNNRANSDQVTLIRTNHDVNIVFTGMDNRLNAIYSEGKIDFDNVTYWGVNGIMNTDAGSFPKSNREEGQNIFITINNTGLIKEFVRVTDGKGEILLNFRIAGDYLISAYHPKDSYYTESNKDTLRFFFGNPSNLNLTVYNVTATATVTSGAVGDVTFTINNESGIVKEQNVYLTSGIANLDLSDLNAGKYNITAVYNGDSNYWPSSNKTSFEIYKIDNYDIIVDAKAGTVEEITNITVTVPSKITGTVTVNINGTVYSTRKINNTTYFTGVSNLPADNYVVNASVSNDPKYVDKTSDIEQFEIVKVSAYNIGVVVDPNPADVGSVVKVIVSVPGDVSGLVSVDVNGSVYSTVKVNDTTYVADVSGLAVGNYVVSASVSNDLKYVDKTSDIEQFDVTKVSAYNIGVVVDPNPAEVGSVVNITVTVPGDVTGVVSVNINGTDYPTVKINDTAYVADVSTLAAGYYVVNASVVDDSKYADKTSDVEQFDVTKVSAYNIGVVVDPNPAEVGSVVNVTVTLPGDVTGVVSVNINGTVYPTTKINNTTYVADVSGLAAGNYVVNASVVNDPKYADKTSDDVTLLVVEDENYIIDAPDLTKYYSGPERFTVNVTYVRGAPVVGKEVKITINGVTYNRTTNENGTASLSINLNSATYDVTTVVDNITVESVVTVLPTIEAEDIESKSKNIVFTATFLDGEGNYLTNGTNVSFNIDGVIYNSHVSDNKGGVSVDLVLNNGKYIITSLNSVTGESISNNITVDLKDVDMILSGDEIIVGENATVGVKLNVDATGNVYAEIGGKNYTSPVNEGNALIIIPGLAAGNYTFQVIYSGDYNYNNASGDVSVNVTKADANIVIEDSVITVGENATVTITLPGDAGGNIRIGNEIVPVENGTAKTILTGLKAGINTIPIIYSGDDKYNPIETNVDVVVNEKPDPVKKNLSIEASADVIVGSEDVVIIVTGLENATGNVSVVVHGHVHSAPIVNGTAQITISGIIGNATAYISYSGDDVYNSAVTIINISVDKNDTIIIYAPNLTKYYKGPQKFVVTVTDAKGQAAPNKTVEITINGVTYKRTTDENGTASLNINLNNGQYPVVVSADDVTVNSSVTVLSTIYSSDVVKMFRNDTQYNAIFTDSNGNPLANIDVSFNIHGIIYNRTTDKNGAVKLNINLDAGDYILTALNPVTGEMKSNTIKVISLIVSDDLTKYYRNASQFVVRIRSADGGYVGAGEKVTFNINGVFYTRTTNATGHAMLNINLHQGNFTITTYHKDCSQGNNIEVLPILSADDLVMKYMDGSQFKVQLVDGQGKAYAGQTVTFNINGVFYRSVTDNTGQAKLNINLMPGAYIITSSYNGFNISNTIKISA